MTTAFHLGRRHSDRGFSLVATAWLLACVSIGLWLMLSSGASTETPSANHSAMLPVSLQQSAGGSVYCPIQSIHVGQRVITPGTDPRRAMPTAVDPATWKLVKLRMEHRWQDGTLDDAQVETLLPPSWLVEHNARAGAKVPLPVDVSDLAEPDDPAEVVSVEPCPKIETGPGRVVLTTVNHLNKFLFDLTVREASGNQQLIKVTGWHKLYSESRAWVSVSELAPAELLRGREGPLTVVSLVPHPGTVRVYNMTVEDEHVYYVSGLDMLAHNADCNGSSLPKDYWKNKQAPNQVEPGIRQTTDMKPSSRQQGEVYERRTYYDEHGRSIGQTHFTDHGEPDVHPNPHYHTRDPVTGQVSGPTPGVHPNDPEN